MSKTIIITRTLSVFALLFIGVTSASASEVTGTLSSGLGGNSSGGNSETSGTLGSTVSDNTLGGTVTGGNSNSSGGGGNNRAAGTGQVLGLSTTNSPSFPNAGFDPDDGDDEEDSIWESLMVLATIAGLMTFVATRYQNKMT